MGQKLAVVGLEAHEREKLQVKMLESQIKFNESCKKMCIRDRLDIVLYSKLKGVYISVFSSVVNSSFNPKNGYIFNPL